MTHIIDLFTLLGPNADAGGTWTLPGGAPCPGTFVHSMHRSPCIYLALPVSLPVALTL
ncbi:MAG: hypothetical protein IPN38_20200 [Flavobacteriales bacterium]|nr:hypothetical protein [Flavobacteriales bacterium]